MWISEEPVAYVQGANADCIVTEVASFVYYYKAPNRVELRANWAGEHGFVSIGCPYASLSTTATLLLHYRGKDTNVCTDLIMCDSVIVCC